MRESPKFLNDENRYEGATEGEDSLIPKETVIETQFSEEQLRDIFAIREIYQKNIEKYGTTDSLLRIKEFLSELLDLYGIQTIENCAFYYILKGEGIPGNIDRLDLSENNFRNFIVNGFSSKENISE